MLAVVDPMTVQPSLEPVWQKIEDHRDEAKEDHDRLRKDYTALKESLDRLAHEHILLQRKVDLIEKTPPNIEKFTWTTRQYVVGVVVAFSIGGGMWQLHTDIDKAATQAVNTAKLQEERNTVLDNALKAALAESRLNGLKTDDLSKQLTTYLLQHTK